MSHHITDEDKRRAIEECTKAEAEHMKQVGRQVNVEKIRREYVKLQEEADRRKR